MVSALPNDACLVLLPVNPRTVAQYRAALPPSRAKDAPTAAALPVARRLTHRAQLSPLVPQSPARRACAQLVAHRWRLVGAKVRLTHRLTRALTNDFPHVLQWFPEQDTAIFGDFLRRGPTLNAVPRARRTTLEHGCRAPHVRSTDVIAPRIEAMQHARARTTDDGVIPPMACWCPPSWPNSA
jgi:hypothetical protein